jgi:hypothetical protein
MTMKPLALTFAALLTAATPTFAQDFGSAPEQWAFSFPKADFTQTEVHFVEIQTVIGRDQIPAIHDVSYIAAVTETRLDPREPVLTLEIAGTEPRAYPVRYLMFHEIANDVVGGVPVAVTYCPLCNSGMVFDRRVGDQTISFGVSGKLRRSDMVMYDLETESFWQQAVGEGIVGHFAGTELTQMPAWMESWAEFTERNPEGLVMDAPFQTRNYGSNPYVGYDSRNQPYESFFNGENPPHDIPALMRVVRVGEQAWPISRFEDTSEVVEGGVRLTWRAGQASAMDTGVIAQGKDVGTIRVFDAATGENLPHDIIFAFAYHAFFPEGEWMLGGG